MNPRISALGFLRLILGLISSLMIPFSIIFQQLFYITAGIDAISMKKLFACSDPRGILGNKPNSQQ